MAYQDPYLNPLVQGLITPGEYDQMNAMNAAPPPTLAQQMYSGPPGAVPVSGSMLTHGPAAPAALSRTGQFLANRIPGASRFVRPPVRGAGLAGTAAILGGTLVDQMTGDNRAGNVLGSVLQGAGLGSMGYSAGPIVGTATTIGGGLLGLFQGLNKKEAPDPGSEIGKLLGTFGVSGGLRQDIMSTYERLKETDEDTANTWLASVAEQAQSRWMEEQGNPFAKMDEKTQQVANLQLQQVAAEAMSPYIQDWQSNLNASGRVLEEGMKNFSPQQRHQIRPLIQQYVNMSKNVADAYAIQAQSFPVMNQIAESSWANMQQQQQGGSSGLTELLNQQLAPTGGS